MARTMMDSHDMACRYCFSFAGAICDLTTNSGELVNLLEKLSPAAEGVSGPHFAMEVSVDGDSDCAAGRPHFRGMHHAAMASFGAVNIFVFDLLRKHVGGRVSTAVAQDTEFWQKKVLPLSIGMMGACIGILPMHAACASIGGNGLLVAGASGAGKSTLSVALSQTGFDYVSDDWTYMNIDRGKLSAHGTSAPVKLLPDAARHFQGLASERVGESMNGELAYEVDAAKVFGASVREQCEPRWVVFLERVRSDGSELVPLKAESSRIYLESSVERLPEQLTEATERRANIIDRVSELQCWRFRYGGSPQYAALRLKEFVESRIKEVG